MEPIIGGDWAPEPDADTPPQASAAARIAGAAARVAIVAFIVALPLCIVTSTVRVLVSDAGFYRRGLREHGAEARTGLPLTELDRAALEIVRYWENDADELRIVIADGGQERPLFDAREIQHMKDVKSLMRLLFAVQQATLIYVCAYAVGVFLWARERPLESLARRTLAGLVVGLVAVGAVGAFAATGFDAAWNRFHEIAFSNDLWQLNPARDRLIQMFPEPFWEEATFYAAGLIAAESLVLAAMAGGYLFVRRRGRLGA